MNNDCKNDMHYVQHCFDIIYGSLTTCGVVMNEHWIWSDGCAWKCNLHDHSFGYVTFIKKKIKHRWNFLKLVMEKGSTMV